MSSTNDKHDNDTTQDAPAAVAAEAPADAPKRQVVAMGSGGFSCDYDWPIHDDYILRATGKEVPRILYIGAASGDNSGSYFLKAFRRFPCIPSVLPLFSPEAHYKSLEDMYDHVLNQDVIYCGGGQSFMLVSILQSWGLQPVIKQAYEQGTVLAGLSAGANVWFHQALSDYNPGTLSPLQALDILPCSFSPHHDHHRDEAMKHYLRSGAMVDGYGAEDGVGIHFINEKPHVAVTRYKGQRAYSYVKRKGNQIGKETLPSIVHTFDDARIKQIHAWADKELERERRRELERRRHELVSIKQ